MNNVHLHYLKHARKHTHLSLKDMAQLLEMDVSNLSKYERGKKRVPLHVVLSYHILSQIPLERLFRQELNQLADSLKSKINDFLEHLGHAPNTSENTVRGNALAALISRMNNETNAEKSPV